MQYAGQVEWAQVRGEKKKKQMQLISFLPLLLN